MKKTSFISMLIITALVSSMFCFTALAEDETDYKEAYLNYALDADNHGFSGQSGMIMLNLSGGKIPQILFYSASISYYDANGDFVSPNDENKVGQKNDYSISSGIVIKDGIATYSSPWKKGTARIIPYLPNEFNENENFFCGVVIDNFSIRYLLIYDIILGTYTAISCNENGFNRIDGPIGDEQFNQFRPIDIPVVSVSFNDEKLKTREKTEAMQLLIDNYEKELSDDSKKYKVSNWAAGEIAEAEKAGIIPRGMLDDDLTENISRAEFSAVSMKLYKALTPDYSGIPQSELADIKNHPYEYFIHAAYVYGITNGTGTNEDGAPVFSPDKEITREQLATMLGRIIMMKKYEDWNLTNQSLYKFDIDGYIPFADDESISDYAEGSVYYLNKHDVIKGIDSSHFAPQNNATKEQAIIMALRLYNNFEHLIQ